MRRMLSVISLVLAAGCAQVQPALPDAIPHISVSLRFDPGINDEGISAVDYADDLFEGLKRWAPLGAEIALDDAATRVVQCAWWDMGEAVATTNAGGIALKCLFMYGQTAAGRQELLAHELGHVFGLLHVQDPNATMYPDVNGVTELSQADLDEWARVH